MPKVRSELGKNDLYDINTNAESVTTLSEALLGRYLRDAKLSDALIGMYLREFLDEQKQHEWGHFTDADLRGISMMFSELGAYIDERAKAVLR
jgi:hypothetical protein